MLIEADKGKAFYKVEKEKFHEMKTGEIQKYYKKMMLWQKNKSTWKNLIYMKTDRIDVCAQKLKHQLHVNHTQEMLTENQQ